MTGGERNRMESAFASALIMRGTTDNLHRAEAEYRQALALTSLSGPALFELQRVLDQLQDTVAALLRKHP
jgi:hypothetical protein